VESLAGNDVDPFPVALETLRATERWELLGQNDTRRSVVVIFRPFDIKVTRLLHEISTTSERTSANLAAKLGDER